MKKIFKILVSLIILSAIVYQFRSALLARFLPISDNIKNNFSDIFLAPSPCKEPIPYSLGTFDTQFNISQKYFLDALTDAEAIWEKPFEKDLFIYVPEDSRERVLRINLIYDYRQQATSKLAGLGIVVDDNRASYDALKAKFTVLQKNYNNEKNDFSSRVETFDKRNKAYNTAVEFWNSKGGAPEDEYNKLKQESLELDAESKELQSAQRLINEMVDEINAIVVVLNRLAGALNISVDKYNTIGASRGESFEEGVYSSNGLNSEIDIYEFSSRSKLVRVLSHELGHALGLEHVDDPKAIMYELNQNNSETLTEADFDALKLKCAVK